MVNFSTWWHTLRFRKKTQWYRIFVVVAFVFQISTCLTPPEHFSLKEKLQKIIREKLSSLLHIIINRLPTDILENKSTLETLKTFFPHFKISNGFIPRIFGCITFVHIHNQNRDILDPRAGRCVFLGYSATQKGYKCYIPSSKKLYISIDVIFIETKTFSPILTPKKFFQKIVMITLNPLFCHML